MTPQEFTPVDYWDMMAEVQALSDCVDGLSKVIGPIYGASMCQHTLAFDASLFSLVVGLLDQASALPPPIPMVEHCAPSKAKVEARHDRGGSFFTYRQTRGRHRLGLTAAEHADLGLQLKHARVRVAQLTSKLAEGFPNLAQPAAKADRILASLCRELGWRARTEGHTGHDWYLVGTGT